jgi:hypothetical protein
VVPFLFLALEWPQEELMTPSNTVISSSPVWFLDPPIGLSNLSRVASLSTETDPLILFCTTTLLSVVPFLFLALEWPLEELMTPSYTVISSSPVWFLDPLL